MSRPHPPSRSVPAWPLLALLVALPASTLAHPSWHDNALVPMSDTAYAAVQTALGGGALTPDALICEVDGPITAVHHDPDPGTSGIAGIVVVSGLPFLVPTSVPVQLGDNPDDTIAFLDLTSTPMGYPSFVGRDASIGGLFQLMSSGADKHLQCVADRLLVEVGHPPLIGVITDNGPGGLYLMGVRIVPYADPRIAPFVRIQDLAGHPIPIEELPVGAIGVAHGDFNELTGALDMIFFELDALIPSGPGEPDHLSILRVEARSARLELRARGFSNNETALVSLYDFSAGVKGALLAANAPVDPVDGRWDVRVDFAPVATTTDGIPTHVLAETTNGGSATAEVNIR